MTEEELNRAWDYSWNYFSVHAEQRLKTFNFYLILSAAIAAVVATMCRTTQLMPAGGVLLLCSFPLLGLIFWRLDVRNRELVKHGEAAIKHLEGLMPFSNGSDNLPHVLKIMTREEAVTITELPLRYSHCLWATFLVLGIGGGGFGLILILHGSAASSAPR
jgi:hypothetical protein